jgi:hypothetical protein
VGLAGAFVRQTLVRWPEMPPLVTCFYAVRDLPYALDGAHDSDHGEGSARTVWSAVWVGTPGGTRTPGRLLRRTSRYSLEAAGATSRARLTARE